MRKFSITLNGKVYEVAVEELDTDGAVAPLSKTETKTEIPTESGGATRIYAPISGTILSVDVAEGQLLKKGDTICTLEAIKVTNIITAPADGRIVTVNIKKGLQVTGGFLLATMD